MPTFITFSDEDLARNRIVDPGWYLLDIQGHRTWTPTKDKESNNCHFECVIVRNDENGSVDFAGVPVELQFNDKKTAYGFMEGFLKALGVDLKGGVRYDLESAVGRQIVAMVENNEWQGRISNRVNHKYRPVKS